MSEGEFDTTIVYYPAGVDEVELRTLVFGEDPLIVVEPDSNREGLSLTLSMIDHATAGWLLEVVAEALKEHYGEPEFEEDDDA